MSSVPAASTSSPRMAGNRPAVVMLPKGVLLKAAGLVLVLALVLWVWAARAPKLQHHASCKQRLRRRPWRSIPTAYRCGC